MNARYTEIWGDTPGIRDAAGARAASSWLRASETLRNSSRAPRNSGHRWTAGVEIELMDGRLLELHRRSAQLGSRRWAW
jgi:hypothetical protein